MLQRIAVYKMTIINEDFIPYLRINMICSNSLLMRTFQPKTHLHRCSYKCA